MGCSSVDTSENAWDSILPPSEGGPPMWGSDQMDYPKTEAFAFTVGDKPARLEGCGQEYVITIPAKQAALISIDPGWYWHFKPRDKQEVYYSIGHSLLFRKGEIDRVNPCHCFPIP